MPTGLDPLSPATRAVKRNLLVASVLAITIKAFDVTIDKIPLGGLSISFDNRVFVFLLLISLSYFFAIFLLYYFIDIRNVEDTPRQISGETGLPSALSSFPLQYEEKILSKLRRANPMMDFWADHNQIAEILGRLQFRDAALMPTRKRWWVPSKVRALQMRDFGRDVFKRQHALAPTQSVRQLIRFNVAPGYEESMRVPRTSDDLRAVSLASARLVRKEMKLYRLRFALFRRERVARIKAMRMVYFIRNYGTDGFLPFALAVIAFGVLYEWIPVDWLRHIAPPK